MALIDLIAPPALGFNRFDTVFGDQVAQVKVVLDFPPAVDKAWLSRLANMPGVALSFHMVPSDPMDLLKALNKSVQEYTSRLHAGGDALSQSRWEQSLNNAKELLKKVDQESQKVYKTVLVILVVAPNAEELARRSREVEAACAGAGMKARTAVFRQEDGLKAAAPFGILPGDMEEFAGKEMPAETIAASYPWTASGVNHGHGTVIGRDSSGGLILIDRWEPPEGSGITNPNMNILGTSGGGKSFAVKTILLREYALGARILILDPEREYRKMCRELGGTWINAVGGKSIINPLEIRPVPDIDPDDEEENEKSRGPLASHLQRLKTFFQLYLPGLDDIERAELEDALLEAYRQKGIEWETRPEAVDQWPTVKDVYEQLKSKRLSVLFKSAVEGADSSLWLGQTSIPPISDFTVLDIRDLTDAADEVRKAQYFNILSYAWDLVREGRATGKKTFLVVDEAWLLADPNTPQAIGFLRDLSKRIRKYQGCLVIVTQNIVDFLAPELARLGQPVITNASQKLLMRQESRDLEALQELFKLSEAEVDLLANARKGEGLLLAGNQRVHTKIEAAPHEFEVIA
ncbi:MAG: ATP-binding protein [Thermoanaerobacteraceae bacterium]|nr:ATP-binding protein [Thermoanaerobacteraceae bacterium]